MNSTLNFLGKKSGFENENTSAFFEKNNTLTIIDCGFTVFNIIKEKFDLKKYKKINVIITHLHNDHAGSLSQLILYLWFLYNKKVSVISKCKNIKKYLEITGTPDEAYEILEKIDGLQFIETEHTEYLDTFGFFMKLNGKNILYTGDTKTLEPFNPFFNNIDELYVDVSKFGGAHIKIDDVIDYLLELKNKGINIYLIHIDDIEYVHNITKNAFYL